MADIIKPDEILAKLQQQLATAKTNTEKEAITKKINERQQELFGTSGFTNVGFGGEGYYLPGGGQGVGKEVLEPTGTPGVYQKSVITSDVSADPYGRKSLSVEGNKRIFYDANGNPLTPEQVAQTEAGQSFAAAGWDIGYGPGVLPSGTTLKSNAANAASAATTTAASTTPTAVTIDSTAEEKRRAGQSAYDLLFSQFQQYGLGSLVEPLKTFVVEGLSPAEFTMRLRDTYAYQKRFAANKARINKGLAALSEAEYIGLEDQYQNIMRQYGMPETYYARGEMGKQEGFEKLIAGDVSAAELETRISTAYNRVINSNPEVVQALKQFYPNITNGDILSYALDPEKALTDINKKVTAAEIQGAATMAGLNVIKPGTTPEQIAALQARATELASYGVTKEQAQQGFQTIADILPRGGQLASIYGQPAYTQTTAEQEVFGLAGATEAAKQRKKLTALEQASFSGTSGMAGTALGRERAGQF